MSRVAHNLTVAVAMLAFFIACIYGAAWYYPDPGIAGLQRAGINYDPSQTYWQYQRQRFAPHQQQIPQYQQPQQFNGGVYYQSGEFR